MIDKRAPGFVAKSPVAIFMYNNTSYLPVNEPGFLLISKGSPQGHHKSSISGRAIFLQLKMYVRVNFFVYYKMLVFPGSNIEKNYKSLADEGRK